MPQPRCLFTNCLNIAAHPNGDDASLFDGAVKYIGGRPTHVISLLGLIGKITDHDHLQSKSGTQLTLERHCE